MLSLPTKIMILATEDWFVLSHFRPLLAVLHELSCETVVVTNSTGRFAEIERLGARAVAFDFARSSLVSTRQWSLAQALCDMIRKENPGAVHAIGLKPMTLTAFALRVTGLRPAIIHLTGRGQLAINTSLAARFARCMALVLIRGLAAQPTTLILAENTDDLNWLIGRAAWIDQQRTVIIPGAGVDPNDFPPLPQPNNTPPTIAFVGRMIHSKGVGVLVEAYQHVRSRGLGVRLDLYGDPDPGNTSAIAPDLLAQWQQIDGITWHGRTNDIVSVWRHADICVVPSLGGEGMPRAMLEAAACARPLIVTEVPGLRHFVRHGVEGLVVLPDDSSALAEAIAQLIAAPAQRAAMGQSAQRRVLDGFTVAHVQQALLKVYDKLALVGRALGFQSR